MTEQTTKSLNRDELEAKVLADLHLIAAELEIEGYRMLRKEELIDQIVDATSEVEVGGEEQEDSGEEQEDKEDNNVTESASAPIPEPIKADEFWESEIEPVEEQPAGKEDVTAAGVLDIRPDGFGLLRVDGYIESREDVYISASQVRRLNLRPGDEASGPLRAARRGEKHSALRRIDTVNGLGEDELETRPRFEKLAAEVPSKNLKISFARGEGKLLKGLELKQGSRTLLASASGRDAGVALQQIGRGLAGSDGKVFALLVDVPPETESSWQSVEGVDIAAASYDMPRRVQRQVADLVIERAKRLVEAGQDVVLLIDCISDLGRGYGSDLNGLHRSKRVFGSGRSITDGGSLTVVATLNGAYELVSDKALTADLRAIATDVVELQAE